MFCPFWLETFFLWLSWDVCRTKESLVKSYPVFLNLQDKSSMTYCLLPLKDSCLFCSFCKQEVHFLLSICAQGSNLKTAGSKWEWTVQVQFISRLSLWIFISSTEFTKWSHEHTLALTHTQMCTGSCGLTPLSHLTCTLQALSEEVSVNTRWLKWRYLVWHVCWKADQIDTLTQLGCTGIHLIASAVVVITKSKQSLSRWCLWAMLR